MVGICYWHLPECILKLSQLAPFLSCALGQHKFNFGILTPVLSSLANLLHGSLDSSVDICLATVTSCKIMTELSI